MLMDPSSTANRHDILGPGSSVDCTPTTGQVRGWDNSNSHTLTSPVPNSTSFQKAQADRGAIDRHSTGGSDAPRAAAPEMPTGALLDSRIPTARDTRDQLETARRSELPVGPSRTAQTHPPAPVSHGRISCALGTVTPPPSSTATAREHQHPHHEDSVVPQNKTYGGEAGQSRSFAKNTPPELPPRTGGQHRAAPGVGGGDRTTIPGSGLGRQVQGVFAQVHVGSWRPSESFFVSTHPR